MTNSKKLFGVLVWVLGLTGCFANPLEVAKGTRPVVLPDTLLKQVKPILKGLEGRTFAHRLDVAGQLLLGRPYMGGPLGEGDSRLGDSLPRFRLDGFDCLTYIETVEALARATSPETLVPTLDRIRYESGRVGWQYRNHYTEAEWIPANSRAGHIRVVRDSADSLETPTLARGAFYGKRGFVRPDTTVSIGVLSRERAVAKFTPAAQIFRIRGVAFMGRLPGLGILHTGFLIERPGRPPVLRHASQAGTVREQPLADYLRSKPKFAGIVLWEYVE